MLSSTTLAQMRTQSLPSLLQGLSGQLLSLLCSASSLQGAVQTNSRVRTAVTQAGQSSQQSGQLTSLTEDSGPSSSHSGTAKRDDGSTREPGKQPEWDWNFISGTGRSRKPAIKKPQRHQWLFCNPKYNAERVWPSKILIPHAPTSAQHRDEQQVYRNLKKAHRQKDDEKFHKKYLHWLQLRDNDWKKAFEEGLAHDVKQHKKVVKAEQREQRSESWLKYKLSLASQQDRARLGSE